MRPALWTVDSFPTFPVCQAHIAGIPWGLRSRCFAFSCWRVPRTGWSDSAHGLFEMSKDPHLHSPPGPPESSFYSAKCTNLIFIQDQLGQFKPAPVLRRTCLLDKRGICCHAVNRVTVCIYRAKRAHWPPVFCQTNEYLITPTERDSEMLETHSRTELYGRKFPLESNLNSLSGSVSGVLSLREVVVIILPVLEDTHQPLSL